MQHINDAKRICLERDAQRCRHCGTTDGLVVIQLVNREGRLDWQLSNLITLCDRCRALRDKSLENHDSKRIGVVLCGGRGSRLYPLTKFQNKHTLPIGLVPMLFYPLKTLRAFGVYRALVVIDRDGADEIISMLGSGKEFGMDISYKVQEGAGGIAEALYLAKDFMRVTDDELVCILGDNIFDNTDLNADKFKWAHRNNNACVFVKEVSNPQDYGVAIIEDGKVTKIVEKPKEFVSNLGVVGLYIYSGSSLFGLIKSLKPSNRGELEISSLNDHYAKYGLLQHHVVTGYWGDAGGSIKRYAECNMHGAKKANVSEDEIDNFRSVVFDEK